MFILEPPSKIHFSNTSGAVIGCSATGFPSVRISWVLADGSQVIDVNSLRYVRSNGELVFPPFPSAQYRQDIHSTVCTLSFDLHCIQIYKYLIYLNHSFSSLYNTLQIYRCIASNSFGTIRSRDCQVRAGKLFKQLFVL